MRPGYHSITIAYHNADTPTHTTNIPLIPNTHTHTHTHTHTNTPAIPGLQLAFLPSCLRAAIWGFISPWPLTEWREPGSTDVLQDKDGSRINLGNLIYTLLSNCYHVTRVTRNVAQNTRPSSNMQRVWAQAHYCLPPGIWFAIRHYAAKHYADIPSDSA